MLLQIRQPATRTYNSKDKSWPGETAKSVAAKRNVRTVQAKVFSGHLRRGIARSVPEAVSARSVEEVGGVKPASYTTFFYLPSMILRLIPLANLIICWGFSLF